MASKNGLGKRIKEIRAERGMSQSALANLLGVTPTAVWNWEANGIQPRPPMLASIAKALGVTPTFLLTGQANAPAKIKTAAEIIKAAAEEIAALNGVPVSRVHIEWRIGA